MRAYCEPDEWLEFRGHPCGTVACIAGWALILDRAKGSTHKEIQAARDHFISLTPAGLSRSDVLFKRAMKLLGLNTGQAKRLFVFRNWPSTLRIKPEDEDNVSQAIRRIKHFIETNGAE